MRPVVRDAVRDVLRAGQASIDDIVAATGRSVYSVRDAVGALQERGDPCIANLMLRPRRDEPTAAGTVAAGIATRSPLERAWAGESVE